MASLRFFLVAIAVMLSISAYGQNASIDSVKQKLLAERNDTLRMVQLGVIARLYKEINPDSTYRYAEQMLQSARDLEYQIEEAVALGEMGYALLNLGNYPRSLQTLLQSIAIVEDPASERNVLPNRIPPYDEYVELNKPARFQRLAVLSKNQQYASILYNNSMNFKKALHYSKAAVPLAEESTNTPILIINYITLGRTYMQLKMADSALLSFQKGYEHALESNDRSYLGSILLNTGRVYLSLKESEKAKSYFKRALRESRENNYYRGVVASDLELADLYKTSGQPDSNLYHIRNGLAMANSLNAPDLSLRCYTALAGFYQKSNTDSTVKYQALIIQINKEFLNAKQVQQFQNIDIDEQQRLAELEAAQREFQAKLRTNILLGGIFTLVVVAFFLYRNNRTKQKAKQHIEEAYEKLKATQSQLIQSEKMASLGELTAGIAHEIQNPLNFVNNFSEVNSELIAEMKDALGKGKVDEALAFATTIQENESKIASHGKRADGIVKGMLQHSRKSTGQKELTEINVLCDEYLRLAYHGLRAKDKSFNASFKTDLDSTIGKINIVPQELGRVILNLINNAFYAVTERKKTTTDAFEPTVSITTKNLGGTIEIRVIDNGNGIPSHIKDKIFQPFFTSKPTGQGTGLGLSISYDVVKSHEGELKVETEEGKGTTFIVSLPAQ